MMNDYFYMCACEVRMLNRSFDGVVFFSSSRMSGILLYYISSISFTLINVVKV